MNAFGHLYGKLGSTGLRNVPAGRYICLVYQYGPVAQGTTAHGKLMVSQHPSIPSSPRPKRGPSGRSSSDGQDREVLRRGFVTNFKDFVNHSLRILNIYESGKVAFVVLAVILSVAPC